jgi:tRNA A-37 threonylcarbamoyl transferase component Bud32
VDGIPAAPPPVTVHERAWLGAGRPRRPSGASRYRSLPITRAVRAWTAVLAASAVGTVLLLLGTELPGPLRAADDAAYSLRVAPDSDTWDVLVWAREVLDGGRAGYRLLWVPTVLLLAWLARWRHLALYVGIMSLVAAASRLAGSDAALARAVRSSVTGSAADVVIPAWPIVVVSAVATATLHVLAPAGRARRAGWLAVVVAVSAVVLARLALGLDTVFAAAVSAALGCSATALAFALLAPECEVPVTYRRQVAAHLRLDEARRSRVLAALRDQLGLDVKDLAPYRLDGSAGSTPCRLHLAAGPVEHLFGKLYSTSHLRSDRRYKLARVLLYGRLEDEAPFSSVRRLVEHEDYMLRLLRDNGVRVPEPLGVVEVAAGREYMLVTELVPDAVELLQAELTDEVVDDALRQVRGLWRAGVAHRDIKPSNVLVRGSRVYLVDVSFGELRPSGWRQAVDLGNMLLSLALTVEAPRVLRRARLAFSEDELAEAVAASGSVTIPRQLRKRVRADGRDLLRELRAALPPHPPLAIQRWSVRRVALATAVVVSVPATVGLAVLNLRAGQLL